MPKFPGNHAIYFEFGVGWMCENLKSLRAASHRLILTDWKLLHEIEGDAPNCTPDTE